MTRLLRPDSAGMAEAVAVLRGGGLVSFGTETVYGLGADATNGLAVASVFGAKGRPRFNPLICHFADAGSAFEHVEAGDLARRLAALFWPGPLTLVLPRRVGSKVDLLTAAGLDSLAVRVPGHPVAQAFLAACGVPVAAPSANRSGAVSPTEAAHVMAELGGRIDAVLDCGPATVGLESTVLDLTGAPVLLRPGGISVAAIEAAIGAPVARAAEPSDPAGGLRGPGMLRSHYAPSLPVRLNAARAEADEALLAFGAAPEGAGLVFNLSPAGDLTEAASRLFAGLRLLDSEAARMGLRGIAVMKVPGEELGEAINDRLQRAAAPRGA